VHGKKGTGGIADEGIGAFFFEDKSHKTGLLSGNIADSIFYHRKRKGVNPAAFPVMDSCFCGK
jgi:hypothetical protein